MQIKRVEIKNFRKLTNSVVIDGFGKGVNVIAGENEEGKSTFLLALKAAFFQKHNATSQIVKSYQPYNMAVRPEVTVEFELLKQKYKISKGFCVKPFISEFHTPDSVYQGAEAEERIRDLFQLKKANDSDCGMWGLLWLDQATAEDGLRTTEVGREGLAKLLESDVASIVAGNQGRALLKSVADDYSQYFTLGTGKERNLYKEARELRESTRSAFEEHARRYEIHQQQLKELTDKLEVLETFRRNRSLENAQKSLDEAVQNLQALSNLRLELQGFEQAERVAKLEFEKRQTAQSRHQSLIQQAEKVASDLTGAEQTIKSIQLLMQTGEKDEEAARTALHKFEKLMHELEQSIRFAEQQEQYARAHHEVESLDAQIETLQKMQVQLDSLVEEQKKVSLTRESLENLRYLAAEKLKAESRADAALTRVVLRPEKDRSASINGETVKSGKEMRLSQRTIIDIDGWGQIDVTPGGTDGDKIVAESERASEQLVAALAKVGVSDMNDAEMRYEKSAQLLSEIKRLKDQVSSAPGKDGIVQLKNKRKILEQQLNRLLEAFPDSAQSPSAVPSGKDVSGALLELRKKREDCSTEVKTARSEVERLASISSDGRLKLTKAAGEKQSLERAAAELEAQLTQFNADALNKDLLAEAEEKYLLAQNTAKLKRIELTKLEGSDAETRHKAAKEALLKIDLEIRTLREATTHLSAAINAEGQAGLGEQFERCRGEMEVAEQNFERTDRNARAIKLLYETLVECERQAKEHFLEPVAQKLAPHLLELFDDGQISIDSKKMEITHIDRGGIIERYDDLSVGTREQLSVLTRLAVAQLLQEKGLPSVVILDDALVYSDERRLAKLKDILVRLSTQLQVIILTCRPSDYADLVSAKQMTLKGKPKTAAIPDRLEKSAHQQLKLL